MKKAWILNVGTEVTSGRVINTNAAHLARELERVGVEVENASPSRTTNRPSSAKSRRF